MELDIVAVSILQGVETEDPEGLITCSKSSYDVAEPGFKFEPKPDSAAFYSFIYPTNQPFIDSDTVLGISGYTQWQQFYVSD